MAMKMPRDRNAQMPWCQVLTHKARVDSHVDRKSGGIIKCFRNITQKRDLGKEVIYLSDLLTHQRSHSPETSSSTCFLISAFWNNNFCCFQVDPSLLSYYPLELMLTQGSLIHPLVELITGFCILISNLT